jgi:epoxyqueuosine reductase
MEPDPELARPPLKPLLFLSNRAFKDKFGKTSAAWRGKKPIQRNAVLALGNYKDVTAVPELVRLIREDPRPVIRRSAIWALDAMWSQLTQEAHASILDRLARAPLADADIRSWIERKKSDG